MADYKAAFLQYMDQKEIKYADANENVVRVAYSGDNLKSIPIFVFFDKDGDNLVQFACWEIATFPDDKYAAGLLTCNALNSKFRWVKFYLDADKCIRAEMDAYVQLETVGEACSQLVRRMVGIIDEAYPDLMKALWS
ncbi:MAG: YbjN domain-containing protein [Clostridiaceae bacterium]|nr:YbjN domain-containing protein [Clostridiaceae bacterium]